MIVVKVALALFDKQHALQQNMTAAEHFSFGFPISCAGTYSPIARESHVHFYAHLVKSNKI